MPYLEYSDDELQLDPYSQAPIPDTPSRASFVNTPRSTSTESESDEESRLRYPIVDQNGDTPASEQTSGQVTPGWIGERSARLSRNEVYTMYQEAGGTSNALLSPSTQGPLNKSANIKSLPIRQLVLPRSQYAGHVPPLPRCSEWRAVTELLQIGHMTSEDELSRSSPTSKGDFEEIELSDFAMYLPGSAVHHKWELRSLQYLTLAAHPYFLFDGVLCIGSEYRYVTQVPFQVCSIGNYGIEHHDVGNNVWIQSDLNARRDIHYKLKTAAPEYKRYHDGFMWLANLAKHFIDYCQAAEVPVTISRFREDFGDWLQNCHSLSGKFQAWYGAYHGNDFRSAITRNIQFLFKESIGVDKTLRRMPIWNELLEMNHIKPHYQRETKTIVTKYVYDCFSHLQFGSFLKVIYTKDAVEKDKARVGDALHLTSGQALDHLPGFSQTPKLLVAIGHPNRQLVPAAPSHSQAAKLARIKTGDVIAVRKDTDGKWQDEDNRWKAKDDNWYFLVTEVLKHKTRGLSFHGIWLYKPSDTACAKMKYPFQNELFLSDNCTCGDSGISEEEVLGVVDIVWHSEPKANDHTFFVRQTYLENERFVTLREEHKICAHLRSEHDPLHPEPLQKYPKGQTVLARPSRQLNSPNELEVYEVLQYEEDAKQQLTVLLRRLQRRTTYDDNAARNELVYTEIVDRMVGAQIYGTCDVRVFLGIQHIPPPYNRGGAGNMFYITHERVLEKDSSARLQPLDRQPSSMLQGYDPSHEVFPRKLAGMDLYCGGGNFGRGLEEGGAIENRYAVDLDKAAIHTYHANLLPNSKTKLFFGSVDDLLVTAMQGNSSGDECVPLPGDVDFISAGSPCQGFSLLNPDKNNDKSLKNQSLVASVAAYVDFYRPKYGILENVVTMARGSKGRDEDVMSQLICALVGLGYQTHLILLDAWSSGSPQSRSRLFVSFAAPGLVPLEHPALSHSHPPGTKIRGLGKLANGEPIGSRLRHPTPIKFVSPEECFRDLPFIGDGMTGHCTQFPDHVTESLATEDMRGRLQAIPLFPRGSNFASAWNEGQGVMSREDRHFFPPSIGKKGTPSLRVQPSSRAWQRLEPDRLMGTVTVTLQVASARGSPSIHYNETRCLTLLEFRRAQSFPDTEVLVGSRAQCMKLIGNSVARTVAVSLGLKLREAWLKTGNVTPSSKKLDRLSHTQKRLTSGTPTSALLPYQTSDPGTTQVRERTSIPPTTRVVTLKRYSKESQDPRVAREGFVKRPRLEYSATTDIRTPLRRAVPTIGNTLRVRRTKQILARSFAASSASSSSSVNEQKQAPSSAQKPNRQATHAQRHTFLPKLMAIPLPQQDISSDDELGALPMANSEDRNLSRSRLSHSY